jgi:hypothetical protein
MGFAQFGILRLFIFGIMVGSGVASGQAIEPFWKSRLVKERIQDPSPKDLYQEGTEGFPANSAGLKPATLFDAKRARIQLLTFRTPISFDYEFTLLVVDGKIRRAFLVSTARTGSTPILGVHRLEVPVVNARPWPWKTSIKYENSPMYWGLNIHEGYYFHSSPHYGNLGRPASKGCIRASIPDAMEVFDLLVNQMSGVAAYSVIFQNTDLNKNGEDSAILNRVLENSGWTVDSLKEALKASRNEIVAVSQGDLELAPGVPVDSHVRPFSGEVQDERFFPCCSDVNCWDYFHKKRTTLLLKASLLRAKENSPLWVHPEGAGKSGESTIP